MPVGISAYGGGVKVMKRKKQQGFTLLEASIAIVIVGFLIMGGLAVMGHLSDTSRYKSTQKELASIKEALVSFYINRTYLPCPDVNGDGKEDIDGDPFQGRNLPKDAVQCQAYRGYLPYVTLGIGGGFDAWGQPYKYAVYKPVAKSSSTACSYDNNLLRPASESSEISVYNLAGSAKNATTKIGSYAAFLVLSTGKNGAQTNAGMSSAFSGDGGCSHAHAFEQENCDANSDFRSGAVLSDGGGVKFDDLVVWAEDTQLRGLVTSFGLCEIVARIKQPDPYDPTARADIDYTTGATVHNSSDGNYKDAYFLFFKTRDDNITTSDADDKIKINGNVEKDLNLKGGNNILFVGGQLTSGDTISAGAGNDVVRIEGNLAGTINLGNGDNWVEVGGNVTGSVITGSGNDEVHVYGNAQGATFNLGAGDNKLYIAGTISKNGSTKTSISTSGGGSVTVYYGKTTKPASSQVSTSGNVTFKCYISNAWKDCP